MCFILATISSFHFLTRQLMFYNTEINSWNVWLDKISLFLMFFILVSILFTYVNIKDTEKCRQVIHTVGIQIYVDGTVSSHEILQKHCIAVFLDLLVFTSSFSDNSCIISASEDWPSRLSRPSQLFLLQTTDIVIISSHWRNG